MADVGGLDATRTKRSFRVAADCSPGAARAVPGEAGNDRGAARVVLVLAEPGWDESTVRSIEMRGLRVVVVGLGLLATAQPAHATRHDRPLRFEQRSLDGSNNNRAHPAWGQAGTAYRRIAPARYADGVGAQASGPSPRYISNRIFNDLGQNLFSERRVSQWVWTWGQFIDHTFGLAQDGGEKSPIGFDAADPLECVSQRLRHALLHARQRRARVGHEPGEPAPADEHRQLVHRRLAGLRRHGEPPGVAARGTARRHAAQQRAAAACSSRRLPAARDASRQRGERAGDGGRRPAARPARRIASSPATSAPTRTSR